MSTTARKARKRAGIKHTETAKMARRITEPRVVTPIADREENQPKPAGAGRPLRFDGRRTAAARQRLARYIALHPELIEANQRAVKKIMKRKEV